MISVIGWITPFATVRQCKIYEMRACPLISLRVGEFAHAQTSTTCNNTPVYSPCELVFELGAQRSGAAEPIRQRGTARRIAFATEPHDFDCQDIGMADGAWWSASRPPKPGSGIST